MAKSYHIFLFHSDKNSRKPIPQTLTLPQDGEIWNWTVASTRNYVVMWLQWKETEFFKLQSTGKLVSDITNVSRFLPVLLMHFSGRHFSGEWQPSTRLVVPIQVNVWCQTVDRYHLAATLGYFSRSLQIHISGPHTQWHQQDRPSSGKADEQETKHLTHDIAMLDTLTPANA